MTNPVKKRVVTLDDLNVLNQNAAYARQKGEAADAAALRAATAAEQAEQAAGYLPDAAEAAGHVRDAREAAEYLAPLAAAKDQADQNHARAEQDHQTVVDNVAGIAQQQAANNTQQAANNAAAAQVVTNVTAAGAAVTQLGAELDSAENARQTAERQRAVQFGYERGQVESARLNAVNQINALVSAAQNSAMTSADYARLDLNRY